MATVPNVSRHKRGLAAAFQRGRRAPASPRNEDVALAAAAVSGTPPFCRQNLNLGDRGGGGPRAPPPILRDPT